MPGLSVIKRLGNNFYANFTFLIPLGNEELIDFNDKASNNFLLGLAGSQTLLFIPKFKYGLTFGLGVYQRWMTSKVYQNDYGLHLNLGLKF